MSALRNRVLRLERMTPADEGDKVRAIFLVAPGEPKPPVIGFEDGQGRRVMRLVGETLEALEARCEAACLPGRIAIWAEVF